MRALSRLLRAFVFRPLAADPVRTALTVFSVALGVGVVVAIDLAGDAATGSFESSLVSLVGETDFAISANGGVDEEWAARLATLPRNLRVSPVIEADAYLDGIGVVPLYGVDAIAQGEWDYREPERDALPPVALPQSLAARLGVAKGDRVSFELPSGNEVVCRLALVAESGSEFIALDMADAQELAGRLGRLDRIEVTVLSGESFEEVEQELKALLPPGYAVEKPGARGEENQRMLRAFRWNLRVLSYISLVVGAFLIYNTIAVSVVRRRAEIGVLRALGTSRGGILSLFLGEALALGLAGSAFGILLGRVLAEGAVGLIAGTVDALYVSSRPAPVELTWTAALIGLAAGALVAVLSALGPSLEAMRVGPVEAMGRGGHETRGRLRWRRNLALSVVLAACAAAAAQAGPVDGRPLWGYASALLAIGAAAMAAPAVVLAVNRLTRTLVRRWLGAPGMLAGRSLAAALPRTAVITAALATAVAMMAAVAIMVGSFRETVLVWLDQQLRADLYVRPAGRSGAGRYPPLPAGVAARIRGVHGVEAVDEFHAFEFRYEGRRANLGAGDMDIVRRHGRLRLMEGDHGTVLASLPGEDRVLLSEPFANKNGLRTGDTMRLPLGGVEIPVTVAGVYYEYSSELGYVILDRSTLLRYLPTQPATNLAVYLRPGSDAGAVRREIQAALGRARVVVAENRDLREAAIVIFDRTFAITYALEAVAILVAMLGAANSLLALVLDRRREFGMLRFLGASPEQVRAIVLAEAGFLGLLGNLLGLALGGVLSLLLIYVVNRQSFGWTIQFYPPVALLLGALVLIWAATIAAAFYPARVAMRLEPIEVVHLE
ncbi:MAG: ABC transporter permease [Bryobacterales bacterium]|nr:ABC transporter permease [Bryobacterales bacterium]